MTNPTWNHVTAPISKKILITGAASRDMLFAANKEMHDAFMEDADNPIIDPRVIYLRELAIDALDDIISVDGVGEIDYDAAVKAIQYYWSDGQHGYANYPTPAVDTVEQDAPAQRVLDPATVIDPTLSNLRSEAPAVYEVLSQPGICLYPPLVLSLVSNVTWLRNEMSERCDVDDFDDDRWEDMQAALNMADAYLSKNDVVNAIRYYREYWSRWERYSM